MNFGTLAKECLEAAEALKKATFSDILHHWGFQRSHLQKNSSHRNGNQFNGHGGESHGWQASGNKAKKTTRQHTECFSLYTNVTDFIKSCSTYSYDRHTNTLHTGSHQHHEPVNNMPKTGQASSTLGYSKLWLDTNYRTHSNSLPHPCTPPNKAFTREQGADNHGSLGTLGNLGDTTYITELCASNLRGGGSQRPVINLKGLNQFVKTEHFKMEGLTYSQTFYSHRARW